MPDYTVKQGDCIASIAFSHGFFWETVWNHVDNNELKTARNNPNVLLSGDRVVIPPLREKEETGATEKRHRFRRRGVPAKLRLQILEEPPEEQQQTGRPASTSTSPPDSESRSSQQSGGQPGRREKRPRANVPYVLDIDGDLTNGTTDADGVIECRIPPNARQGRLILNAGAPNEVTLPLKLGHLDPLAQLSGIQGRLANLGYLTGSPTGQTDQKTTDALCAFQHDHGIPETGQPDEATRNKLLDKHGY